MHRVNTIFIRYIAGYHSGEDTVLRRSFRIRRREVSYVDIDVSGEHHGRVDKCSVFTRSVGVGSTGSRKIG
jgi:hypothetical protein